MKQPEQIFPDIPPRTPDEIKALSVLEAVMDAMTQGASQPPVRDGCETVLAEIRRMLRGARPVFSK